MEVQKIMTSQPVACTPTDPISKAATVMMGNNCGAVPVIESENSKLLVGIVTDRDIGIGVCTKKQNPMEVKVSECMKSNPLTCTAKDSLETVLAAMQKNKVRRIPVVDANKNLIGIVAMADLARAISEHGEKAAGLSINQLGQTLVEISKP